MNTKSKRKLSIIIYFKKFSFMIGFIGVIKGNNT